MDYWTPQTAMKCLLQTETASL